MLDQKVKTTTSQNSGQLIRRKVIKIKDQTSTTIVNIWSNKVIDTAYGEINIHIRIYLFQSFVKKIDQ